MDLVFNALPDVFSYQSFRHTPYDAPWLNDVNSNKARRSSEKARPSPATASSGSGVSCGGGGAGRRDSCPLCQEKQRRPLATYIRSKSRQDKREESSIQEEDEEEEDAEASAQQQQQQRPPVLPGATAATRA